MKSQTARGGKQNSFSGTGMGSHQNSYQGFSGQRKPTVKPTGSSSAASVSSQNRLIDLLANAAGKTAVATVSSGARYKGIVSSLNIGPSGEEALSIVLVKPVLVSRSLINEKTNVDSKLPAKLVIESKDLIDIELARGESVQAEDSVRPTDTKESTSDRAANGQTGTTTETTIPTKGNKASSVGFKTDRDISAGFNTRERELQRWVPDKNTPELSLEDDGGVWDQFKVNEERFGVESSYDEHLYTTKINTSAKDYQDRVRQAEQLAREIEGSTTSDHHVMEERGVTVDDSGLDEEDKYSGVIQDTAVDTRGNELMAALRNASISNEIMQAPVVEGKYTTPRQRAAQYHNDPAIVSSSATRKPGVIEKADSKTTKQASVSIPPKPQVSKQPQGEAFRLNAQSEFNALREFSANFKIPHKIPNDLLPILAKDKLKQDEIMRKQEDNKEVKANSESSSSLSKASTAAKSPALAKSTDVPGSSEPKKAAPKFKLNPKAAAFTPSKPLAMSPVPSKANFHKSSNTSSPRISNQRPYSGSSSSGSAGKRHYQVSPAEFFGGADKVPTIESQQIKADLFKTSFSWVATAVRKHQGESTPLVLEKAYKTPPTWGSTVDESYDKIIARQSSSAVSHLSHVAQGKFMTSPAIPAGVPHMMAGGYIGGGGYGGKYPVSPHMQQPMGGQFQQQFHPSMMYSQLQGGIPPGQPQVMYAPPGMDPSLFPPGGFMMPGYMGSPSPANVGAAYQGAHSQSHQSGQGAHHHQGGRRYNQNKRAGGDER